MSGAEAPSGATMVDAQLTNARVLKPFDGFERVYQGVSAATPIAFPGIVDPRAAHGQPGFDPRLMLGIPVPEGARVLLWLPMCFAPVPPANPLAPFQFYSYRLVWRFRNLADYRNPPARTRRFPYHFPRQTPGAVDTTPVVGGVRLTVPASWHVIGYEQPEPAAGTGELVVRTEKITPKLDSIADFVQPLLPDGSNGVLQQGVLDPETSGGVSGTGAGSMPLFVPFWTDAEGDELIILANRETIAPEDDVWDFTDAGADLAFSNVYGTGNGLHPVFRDIGIYMQTGTNP